MPKLSQKQIDFADGILDGKPASQAYVDAKYKTKHAESAGSRLLKNVKVCQYIDSKREITSTENTLTRQKIREIRAEIALDEKSKPADVLTALRDDSKMQGWDAPDKIEHSGGLRMIAVSKEDEQL